MEINQRNTSIWPFPAAQSAASCVHPSSRLLCNHLRVSCSGVGRRRGENARGVAGVPRRGLVVLQFTKVQVQYGQEYVNKLSSKLAFSSIGFYYCDTTRRCVHPCVWRSNDRKFHLGVCAILRIIRQINLIQTRFQLDGLLRRH